MTARRQAERLMTVTASLQRLFMLMDRCYFKVPEAERPTCTVCEGHHG